MTTVPGPSPAPGQTPGQTPTAPSRCSTTQLSPCGLLDYYVHIGRYLHACGLIEASALSSGPPSDDKRATTVSAESNIKRYSTETALSSRVPLITQTATYYNDYIKMKMTKRAEEQQRHQRQNNDAMASYLEEYARLRDRGTKGIGGMLLPSTRDAPPNSSNDKKRPREIYKRGTQTDRRRCQKMRV